MKLRSERMMYLSQIVKEGRELTEETVAPYAKNALTRVDTYKLLSSFEKIALFPKEYENVEKAAEGYLVKWLEFPTELDAVPDEIEYNREVGIAFEKNELIYHVFNFRVNNPHWAAKEGWMLGAVGPSQRIVNLIRMFLLHLVDLTKLGILFQQRTKQIGCTITW